MENNNKWVYDGIFRSLRSILPVGVIAGLGYFVVLPIYKNFLEEKTTDTIKILEQSCSLQVSNIIGEIYPLDISRKVDSGDEGLENCGFPDSKELEPIQYSFCFQNDSSSITICRVIDQRIWETLNVGQECNVTGNGLFYTDIDCTGNTTSIVSGN